MERRSVVSREVLSNVCTLLVKHRTVYSDFCYSSGFYRDIVWLDFEPRTGKEQVGHRPAIVLSPKQFNSLSSLVFVCPITSKVKGFSFEVLLPEKIQTKGVVLIHHLTSVDWKTRRIKLIEKAPISVLEEICAKLEPLIF